jgi:hypothetical protein
MKTSKFNPHKVDRKGDSYKVIPKAQRKKIYQLVLDNMRNGKYDNNIGLCIRLVWEMDLDFTRTPDTDLLFPEFGNCISLYNPTKWVYEFNYDRIEWRFKVLKYCIKLCK